MKQQALNQPKNELSNISFQQKSTALSLIITGSATAYYIANMWPMRPIALANDIIPAGFGSLLLTTMGLIIVAEIILQIVLVFGAGSAPEALAHEKQAALKARRNAYGVLVFGATVNTSPTKYADALTAVDAPMLVVVGRQDEAFVAGEFETAVTTHSHGEVHVIDGENHNSIVTSAPAMAIIETWLQDTQLAAQN